MAAPCERVACVHVRAEELALLRFTACVHCITLVAWPGGVVLRESQLVVQ
jgi:hypothetical protein